MTHHINVEKKLHFRFKGSDGNLKHLIIAHPEEKLKMIIANVAMDKIVEINLFEKDGVRLYEGRRDAYYKTRKVDVFI